MPVRVQSIVNYSVTLTDPIYVLAPFETKIFDISAITANLANEDGVTRTLTAEVLTPGSNAEGAPTAKYKFQQIGTRCKPPIAFAPTLKQTMTRSTHKVRKGVNKIQFAFPNYYMNGGVETAPGAACDIIAAIEYPAGVYTQLKFGGAVAGSIPDKSIVKNDPLYLYVPKDAEIYLRIWRNCTAGTVYNGTTVPCLPTDGFVGSTSTTPDLTMGGAITAATVNMYQPILILGDATGRSVGCLTDSVGYGSTDITNDGSGDMGYIEKSLSPVMPVANFGAPSDSATLFNASAGNRANRLAMLAYVTDVIIAYGTNDFASGAPATLAAFNTTINTILALYPDIRIWMPTVLPRTTTSDAWATVGNQTVTADNAARLLVNTAIRDGTVSNKIFGVFEVADQVESGRNSGFFAIDTGSATPAMTADGIHMPTKTHRKIARSYAIDPSLFM